MLDFWADELNNCKKIFFKKLYPLGAHILAWRFNSFLCVVDSMALHKIYESFPKKFFQIYIVYGWIYGEHLHFLNHYSKRYITINVPHNAPFWFKQTNPMFLALSEAVLEILFHLFMRYDHKYSECWCQLPFSLIKILWHDPPYLLGLAP